MTSGRVKAGQGGNDGGAAPPTGQFRALPWPRASEVDGLKLIEGANGPWLLVSEQQTNAPGAGGSRYAMQVSVAPIADPAQLKPVASLPRLLPPPPRWDARKAEHGGFEIVYEEAGGALYQLKLWDGSGPPTAPTRAHRLQSFTRPRFVRAGGASAEISAVLDDARAVVLSPQAGGSWTHRELAPSPSSPPVDDVVVGQRGGWWMVAKTPVSGAALGDTRPGLLSLHRVVPSDAAQLVTSTRFAGFLGFELDAATLPSGEVVVFATGRPPALLLASRPSRPIRLSAAEPGWLQGLSHPTLSVAADRVRLAAIAHGGTAQARIVYAELPLRALEQPATDAQPAYHWLLPEPAPSGPGSRIEVPPEVESRDFQRGSWIQLEPQFRADFEVVVHGAPDPLPHWLGDRTPVVSAPLLAALRRAGVDNVQSFPVLVRRAESGERIEGFSLLNVVGAVDAADPEASRGEVLIDEDPGPKLTQYSHLVLARDRTQDLNLFRLADSPSVLLVHDRVKQKLWADAPPEGWGLVPLEVELRASGDG